MLRVFAVLAAGVIVGRICSRWRLAFVGRIVTFIIWLLLFLLGVEVGSDPSVVGGLATLGWSAFLFFAGSTGGSILLAWLLWRFVRGGAGSGSSRGAEGGRRPDCARARLAANPAGPQGCGAEAEEEEPAGAGASLWTALRGSLVIVGFFAAGCAGGVCGWISRETVACGATQWVLYALMFSVGVTLGADTSLPARIRRLDSRMAWLPLMTAVGSIGGAGAAALIMQGFSAADGFAVGAGFGYYSLSSIFIADLRSVELGTVALLCNIMREIFTLLAAPVVARWAGPLAAISIGGATTFDTTLPVITRAAGRPYVVLSIFHGCALDFSVPFLVTLFCRM